MNKLTVMKGNKKYEILIENYKVIYGSNYNDKFDILRTLLMMINNTKQSEYAKENNNITQVYLNDKIIKSKEFDIYHVNKYYSLSNDFKLNSKSLVSKYLEIIFDDKQYIDTINSLNILFESLSQEIVFQSSISIQFQSMVSKQLIKLLTPYYIDKGYSKNEIDLSIEELIILQLKMIKQIIESDKVVQYHIICLDIPDLTSKIYEIIKTIDNAFILIFTELDNQLILDVCKYYICEKVSFDISNDEEIYRIICDNGINLLTLKEGREYMKNYLFHKGNSYAQFIEKLLIK